MTEYNKGGYPVKNASYWRRKAIALELDLAEVREEIKKTWRIASKAKSQMDAYRMFERMTDRLGYGRTKNNPPIEEEA